MNHPNQAPAVWIGEFRVDRAAQRLWRNDQPIDLVPQVWALLSFLIERPGLLVTKDEILEGAWGGVAVSDAALSQAVRRLRDVFGDDARQPRYVETMHRRGFRLVAPVRTAVESSEGHAPMLDEPTLFVGRALELGSLQDSLATAQRGLRRVLFVEGEAGIGKTALLRSFLSLAAHTSLRAATAQCVEQQGPSEPYMPLLEALDRLARTDPTVLDVLRRYAPTWLVQMPWLLEGNEAHTLERSITDATRGRMLREIALALEVLAAEQPLVLVLEDLHWADRATVDFLLSISKRPDPARLLIVGTYRAAEAIAYEHPIVACVRSLWTSGACTRLSLESFAPAEVRAFLSQRFAVPAITAVADRIHARTEGNPLFLAAMVDHLVERGFITQHAGQWQLARAVETDDLRNIPNSVREMIELQLASLEPGDLKLLQAASVAAVEFRAASVAAALTSSGPGDLESVEHACDFLSERRRLLRPAGTQVWPDGTHTARYRFQHDLYRQVLYDRIAPGQRARLHQRIGERIEQGFATDLMRVSAELVSHFSRSGDDARTVRYSLLAAEQARRRYAIHEAAMHLRDALHHLENLPPGADRDFNELQLRTNLLLAQTYTRLEHPDADERNFTRIATLAAVPSAGRDVFQVQHTLAHIYSLRSMPTQAAVIVDRLAALANPDLPHEQMEAFTALGGVRMVQGRCVDALEATARAAELFGDGDPPACAAFPGYDTKWRETGATIAVQLSATLFNRGFLDQAVRHLQRAIDLCASRVRPYWAAGSITRAAGILCLRGDLSLAQEASNRGFAIAAENGIDHQLSIAAPQRVWLEIMTGHRKNAPARIRSAWEDYRSSHRFIIAPIGPLFLLDACRVVGARGDGLAIADEVWSATRANGVRWYDAEIQRLRGELLLLQGAPAAAQEAESCFVRALDIAREQGHRFYELRAATSWLRLCRGQQNEHIAADALAAAYGTFTEGFDTPDLRAAHNCLQASRPTVSRARRVPRVAVSTDSRRSRL